MIITTGIKDTDCTLNKTKYQSYDIVEIALLKLRKGLRAELKDIRNIKW